MERTECFPERGLNSLRFCLSTAALTVTVDPVPDVQLIISGDQPDHVHITHQSGSLRVSQKGDPRSVSSVRLMLPQGWKGALHAFSLCGDISISQFAGSDLTLRSAWGNVCGESITCISADVRTLRGAVALSGLTGDRCRIHTLGGQVILSGCSFPTGRLSALHTRAELELLNPFDTLSIRCLTGSTTVYAPFTSADAALTSVKGHLLTDGVSVQSDAPRIRMLSVTADLQVIASLDDQAMI